MRNMSGISVLITGATDGLGRATAPDLARKGANVLVHARNVERCGAVLHEIREAGGTARIYCADFTRLSDVSKFLNAERRLDVLINNAGLGIEDHRRESADGHEMVFQVDYLRSVPAHSQADLCLSGLRRPGLSMSRLPARRRLTSMTSCSSRIGPASSHIARQSSHRFR